MIARQTTAVKNRYLVCSLYKPKPNVPGSRIVSVAALQGDPGVTMSLYDLQDRRLQASPFVMNAVTAGLKREALSPTFHALFMMVRLQYSVGSPQPQLQDPCRLVCSSCFKMTASPASVCACCCLFIVRKGVMRPLICRSNDSRSPDPQAWTPCQQAGCRATTWRGWSCAHTAAS